MRVRRRRFKGRRLADRGALAATADIAAVRAGMRSDLYRALRIRIGAIVGPVVATVEFL